MHRGEVTNVSPQGDDMELLGVFVSLDDCVPTAEE